MLIVLGIKHFGVGLSTKIQWKLQNVITDNVMIWLLWSNEPRLTKSQKLSIRYLIWVGDSLIVIIWSMLSVSIFPKLLLWLYCLTIKLFRYLSNFYISRTGCHLSHIWTETSVCQNREPLNYFFFFFHSRICLRPIGTWMWLFPFRRILTQVKLFLCFWSTDRSRY